MFVFDIAFVYTRNLRSLYWQICGSTWRILPTTDNHDDVTTWKFFPRCWPFVRRIHRWPVNSPHKGQWRGALMLSLICAWLNAWINNREAGDLRRHRAHYDVIVMVAIKIHAASYMTGFRHVILREEPNIKLPRVEMPLILEVHHMLRDYWICCATLNQQHLKRYASVNLACFNPLMPRDAYMRYKTRPSLVQIMVCRLFGNKPLSNRVLHCQLDSFSQISIEIQTFQMRLKMSSAKWRPFCLVLYALNRL